MIREEKLRLAKDKNTPIEVLKELSKDQYEVRKLVARNPNTPSETLIELSKDSVMDGNVHFNAVRSGVARNPNTPIKTLMELLKRDRLNVGTSIASNPNTPIEVLVELSKDKGDYSTEVKKAVAANPSTPIETLIELSKIMGSDRSYTYEIRQKVALNPNTPIETLIELSKDGRYEVRKMVALNPNTPIKTLKELSKDGRYEVRIVIAENPNTPIEILKELSNDKDEIVRTGIASNTSTPIETLIELSKDGYPQFYGYRHVRRALAANPNTPIETLIELLKRDSNVRSSIARNPSTPIEILKELSNDEDEFVRRMVAENLKTRKTDLIELSKDDDVNIRRLIAENPNTPIEILVELSKENSIARGGLGKNPNTPIEIIEDLTIKNVLPLPIKDETSLNKLLNREDVNIDLVNRYLKLDIKDEQKISSILLMEKFPSEYKKNFIKEYIIKENISYIKYSKYDGFEISIDNNNCKVLLNDSEILTFDFELKVEKPIITTKEEAIELIKTSTYNEKHYSKTDYKEKIQLEFLKNASNSYKDLPKEFKSDLDVIVAALKMDKRDRNDVDESGWNEWEGYTCITTSKYTSLNIYESLPDSIKNSKEFKDRIFYEFVLPRSGTNDYFRSIIKELYENKDSSIEIKTEICDRLTKKYNASLPSYEDQLADIISTNYENASIYGSDYRMSESDIIDYGYYDLKATFEKQYSHSIYFDDSLRNVIKEVEDYKELSNKMKTIEEKLSNNSETLINFFKEKNIDPKSEEAKKMKQTFNETQDNLINELSEVKEKMNEYTKEKEVLEKTFNDR